MRPSRKEHPAHSSTETSKETHHFPSVQPVLRWAGSKRKLLHHLLPLVPAGFNRYYEPFVGSGCLFFTLSPKRAVLSDVNPELIKFYAAVKADPAEVYRITMSYRRTKRQYTCLREIAPATLGRHARAAQFLFLNRLCFNGLYRTNRQGKFNVPMGTRTGSFPSEDAVIAASRSLRRARLVCGDFERVLADVAKDDFVYLDPPFFSPAQRTRNEYGNGCFTTVDIPRLRRVLERLDRKGASFILSYRYDKALAEELRAFNVRLVEVRRSIGGFAATRVIAAELVVTNRT